MEPTGLPGKRFRHAGRRACVAVAVTIVFVSSGQGSAAAPPAPAANPFARFDLPDAWEARFWDSPNARALLGLSARAVAALVPEQAGIRYCRCPSCDAAEADDPLSWSVARPKVLTCRRCGVTVPNDKFPARNDKKEVPEEAVDVLAGVTHHYPYHEVPAEHRRYPDERLYLAAKRDGEARQFLAKAALYAAVRHHEQPAGRKDPALANVASTILVRFAQVYPAYATHYDQPASAKYFGTADLPPPYRRGYGTAKWDWSGSLDVPLNLVIAYALLRDDPALAEAGRLLRQADPARAVERDLFRASADFVRRQPEEFSEATLDADRGVLAVGRLLNDPVLTNDALDRLDRLARRGFYHDGFWRQGTLSAHRRVLGQLDGWIDRLVAGYTDPVPTGLAAVGGRRPAEPLTGVAGAPMLALARAAGSAVLSDPPTPEVLRAAWPAPSLGDAPRAPALLGGAGLARLAVGQGGDALDLELSDLDTFGPDQIRRQALRLAVGGRTALGDLDDLPGTSTGFEHASVSRNTVVVDGLNQRESLARARIPVPGGNFLFFAADPDFQVVTLDDARAYPQSTSRYRQTLVATAGAKTRYAVGVFEVLGGLQHDQLFHGPAGSSARWRLSAPTSTGPATLLAPGLTFVRNTVPGDGRWFIQSYGEFTPLSAGVVDRPAQAWLDLPGAPVGGVRLHLLGDGKAAALTAATPDPTAHSERAPGDDSGRGSLVLRRRSENGSTLRTTFVTLFEPATGSVPPLKRAGRVKSSAETVVVYAETAEGPEHVVVSLAPGKTVAATLADGRTLFTDGLAVRVSASGLVLAGGTFAELAGKAVRHRPATGEVRGSTRAGSAQSRGWFTTDAVLPEPEALAGRVLLIRHGDGTTRGWTLRRVEKVAGGSRLHVREEPGFQVDGPSGSAQYYQFPGATIAGPHQFRVSRISRGGGP